MKAARGSARVFREAKWRRRRSPPQASLDVDVYFAREGKPSSSLGFLGYCVNCEFYFYPSGGRW